MTPKFETRAVHDGQEADPETGAVIPPIHLSSTFKQDGIGKHRGFEYRRTNNPTRQRLEHQVASLEKSQHGIAFASGSAATTSIQLLLQAGDHVICGDDVYGGTYRFFDKVMKNFDVSYSFIDLTDPDKLKTAIQDNTKMIWLETPTNPLLKVSDLGALSTIAKEKSIMTVVDNTFATPYLQAPFDYGADMVVHSATKYLGGHSDLVGGIVLTNSDSLAERLRFIQNSAGAVPSPFDMWLLSRGIKTLALRMERHCSNAEKMVKVLQQDDRINQIYYPFLAGHPNEDVARKQMSRGGGMVSFDLSNRAEAERFLSNLEIFSLAESLGGVESLAEYPPEMTHGSIEPERRHEIGINDGLIRLSCGIEHVDDLIADVQQSLNKL
ncbi:MAG: trans-sulfuration enzyme family protein [Candidatus Kariarchaeaceae archaeon]|jgi:cystathionine gamma-synthase/cystathionine gamma-lyase